MSNANSPHRLVERKRIGRGEKEMDEKESGNTLILETIPKEVEEEEDDPKDTTPLSHRTRVVVAVTKERRKSLTPSSPVTQDQPIQVDDVIEEEGWNELIIGSRSNMFSISNFEWMPMGTHLEGHIQDTPRKEDEM